MGAQTVTYCLQIEKERILFVDKNVKVGYPPELDSKLRIQSTGGAVYLKATADFPKTRLQLMDVATGEIILLDVQAKHSVANASEPIRFVYENKVEKQTTNYGQDANAYNEPMPNARPALPAPAALTRYAAQMFYAPLRSVGLWKVCAKFHIAFLHRLKRSYLHCLCELLHYSAGNLMGMLSLRFACKTRGNLALI